MGRRVKKRRPAGPKLGPSTAYLFNNEPKRFCEHVLKIRNKQGKLVPFIFNEEQSYLYSRLSGRDLIGKPRQIGITTLFAGIYLAEAIMTEGLRCVLTAHEWPAARSIKMNMLDVMFDSIPERIRPRVSRDNDYQLVFPEHHASIEVHCVTASKGRSGTIHRLHKTEAAYAKSGTAGLSEAVPREGKISTESTGDDPSGEFFEGVKLAQAGNSAEVFHFFPWHKFKEYSIAAGDPLGELTEKEQRMMRHGASEANIRWWRWKASTSEMREPGRMDREYPTTWEDMFRSPGTSYYDPDLLDALEKLCVEPVHQTAEGWKTYREPQAGHRYVLGADVAEGVGRANSAAVIVDLTALETAALFSSNLVRPARFAEHCADAGMKYNKAFLCIERNNHGHAVLNHLIHVCRYPYLYRHRYYNKFKKRHDEDPGWPTDGRTRDMLFEELYNALEYGAPRIMSRDVISDIRTHQNEGGHARPSQGSTGDITIAMGLAVQMLKHVGRVAPIVDTMTVGQSSLSGVSLGGNMLNEVF